MVTFSGDDEWREQEWDDATITGGDQPWTSGQRIKGRLPESSSGGTNYQAGIRSAKELLTSARPDAQTAVIFLSDGNPTFYYGADGSTQGDGSSDDENESCLTAAKTEVKTLFSDYFYTVGVGPVKQYQKLKDLKDVATQIATTNFFEGTGSEALKSAFEEIKANVTDITCTNVKITDVLSENVQLVAGTELTVSVIDANGSPVNVPEGISASSTTENGVTTITLNFPSNYELEKGYTYSVTAMIEPTEKAYQNYLDNEYPNTGDQGTGTYEGQSGLFTNASTDPNGNQAYAEYTYNDKAQKVYYKKPVIQLCFGQIEIQKEIEGLGTNTADTNEPYDQALQSMSFEVKLGENLVKTVQGSELKPGQNGKLSYTVNHLVPGKVYTVTETISGEVEGFTLVSTNPANKEVSCTIKKGETVTASFTNTYEPTDKTLTIKKIVTGNMGNTNPDHQFTFHLKLTKDEEAYTEPLKYADGSADELTVTSTKDFYKFSLPANGQISLKVPAGADYTITETDAEKLGYEVSWQVGDGTGTSWNENNNSCNGTLDVDKTITFKNELEIAPPTGIRNNVIPFSMMLLTAAAGTVWFGLSGRRKRPA